MTPAEILLWAVLLGLCTWRATRFFLNDSILDEARAKWEVYLASRPDKLWRRKALELVTCPWCVSVWVAAFGTAFWRWQVADGLGWFLTALTWLATCALGMAAFRTWDES